MSSLRVLVFGGLVSYRALFSWLTPWVLVPAFLVAPIAQILLFAYLGRQIGTASDEFFVIGNALHYSAIPCLFAMASTIVSERQYGTLAIVMVTPARRLPLILGRSLPVLVNGFAVSAFALVAGGAVLGVEIEPAAYLSVALAVAVTVFSCTGLGLFSAAVGLRVRETAVLSNLIFGLMLIFCGVNIPLDSMPDWMTVVSRGLPLTRGIEAARALADGSPLADVGGLLLQEALVGVAYYVVGLVILRRFETVSRRAASMEVD